MVMRELMDAIFREQKKFTAQASPIAFKGPHSGVYVRNWSGNAYITLECDPGYCGIGAALSASEAEKLGNALIRASQAAREYNAK